METFTCDSFDNFIKYYRINYENNNRAKLRYTIDIDYYHLYFTNVVDSIYVYYKLHKSKVTVDIKNILNTGYFFISEQNETIQVTEESEQIEDLDDIF